MGWASSFSGAIMDQKVTLYLEVNIMKMKDVKKEHLCMAIGIAAFAGTLLLTKDMKMNEAGLSEQDKVLLETARGLYHKASMNPDWSGKFFGLQGIYTTKNGGVITAN